jgi:hypothetical protein
MKSVVSQKESYSRRVQLPSSNCTSEAKAKLYSLHEHCISICRCQGVKIESHAQTMTSIQLIFEQVLGIYLNMRFCSLSLILYHFLYWFLCRFLYLFLYIFT